MTVACAILACVTAEDVPVVEALGGPYRNVPEAQPQLPSALPATNLEEAILVADALRSS